MRVRHDAPYADRVSIRITEPLDTHYPTVILNRTRVERVFEWLRAWLTTPGGTSTNVSVSCVSWSSDYISMWPNDGRISVKLRDGTATRFDILDKDAARLLFNWLGVWLVGGNRDIVG